MGRWKVAKQFQCDMFAGPKQVRRPKGHEHNFTAGSRGQVAWVRMGYERSKELRGLAANEVPQPLERVCTVCNC